MKTVSKKLLSLLLVAILLVSALPFQAFAENPDGSIDTPVMLDAGDADGTGNGTGDDTGADAGAGAVVTKIKHDTTHESAEYEWNETDHWKWCNNPNCEISGQKISEGHSFSTDGKCSVCGAPCPHTVQKPVTTKEPGCVTTGIARNQCVACQQFVGDDIVLSALGHDFQNGKCTRCPATEPVSEEKKHTLTLNAGDGFIGNEKTATRDIYEGQPIPFLPDASLGGTTFVGWYLEDGVTKVESGSICRFTEDTTIYAKYATKTQRLRLMRILNGNTASAAEIKTFDVPENMPLLSFLEAQVKSIVNNDLNSYPGYRWTGIWLDYSGKQMQLQQTDCMNQAQTVLVNYVPKTYTLYFVPNGGTVTPATKTVTFGEKVGTLPTPYLANKVFQGWKDQNGNVYTAATVYQVAGDVSLTASWLDKANVMLYIYVNGDFSGCNRILPMDDFVSGNTLSRANVVKELVKYYTPASGSLSVAGLFDEYTWSSYRANTSKAGTDTITVGSNGTKVYVMINNAKTTTIIPSNPTNPTVPSIPNNGNAYWVVTGPNTGYWVQSNGTYPEGSYWVDLGNGRGYWVYNPNNYTNPTYPTWPTNNNNSNPKTGDTAQLEVAAAVMILAAAALVTMMALRKKRA